MPMFAFITGIFLNSSCNKRNTWQNLLNKITAILLVEYFGAAAIRKFIEIIGKNPFVFNTDFLGWIIAPAFAIISVIVCYYIQKLLHKIPIVSQFVFGGTIQTWKKMFEQEK